LQLKELPHQLQLLTSATQAPQPVKEEQVEITGQDVFKVVHPF